MYFPYRFHKMRLKRFINGLFILFSSSSLEWERFSKTCTCLKHERVIGEKFVRETAWRALQRNKNKSPSFSRRYQTVFIFESNISDCVNGKASVLLCRNSRHTKNLERNTNNDQLRVHKLLFISRNCIAIHDEHLNKGFPIWEILYIFPLTAELVSTLTFRCVDVPVSQ